LQTKDPSGFQTGRVLCIACLASSVDIATVPDKVDDDKTFLGQSGIDNTVISNAELKQAFELACKRFMRYCLKILREPLDFVQDALGIGFTKSP
jgi:hypothetical protein